jgi:hypothetical protein
MVKTQIQLEEWQYAALKHTSASSSRSMSDIIREGVSLFLNNTGKKGVLPMEKLAGKYRPVSGSPLKRHDQAWVESIR